MFKVIIHKSKNKYIFFKLTNSLENRKLQMHAKYVFGNAAFLKDPVLQFTVLLCLASINLDKLALRRR